MTWDWWAWAIIKAVAVTLMAYSFHFGIEGKGVFKTIIFWLFALAMLDVIIEMEGIKP